MKNILVTGGSSGIGEATVKKFSDQGYQVFNLDTQKPAQLFENTHYIPCDLLHIAQITQAVAEVMKKIDCLDVVVSSAGEYLYGTIEETSEADFDRIVDLNLKGTFFLLQSVLPILKKQKQGSIILIGSDQSFVGKKRAAVYGLSKAAIAQLAKSTALDYAPFNVRVNAVCPGTIDTPMYRNAVENTPAAHASEAAKQPLNRVGTSQEVAELIYFLGSDAAPFMTGSLLPIDGGYTAQ